MKKYPVFIFVLFIILFVSVLSTFGQIVPPSELYHASQLTEEELRSMSNPPKYWGDNVYYFVQTHFSSNAILMSMGEIITIGMDSLKLSNFNIKWSLNPTGHGYYFDFHDGYSLNYLYYSDASVMWNKNGNITIFLLIKNGKVAQIMCCWEVLEKTSYRMLKSIKQIHPSLFVTYTDKKNMIVIIGEVI